MAVIDTGTSTAGKANVDTNYNLQVRNPTAVAQTGFVGVAGINDLGTVTGSVEAKSVRVTQGHSLSVAPTTILMGDTFNATAQNSTIYRAPIATMTVTFAAGFANINGGGITTINTNAALQTYRTFPLFGIGELRCIMKGYLTATPQANCTIELGLFTATLPGAAAPSDGIFFRYNTSAELRGVINYNGVETQTSSITPPSINVNHSFAIVVHEEVVQFWIDDVLQASLDLQVSAPTQGQPYSAEAQPLTFRQYIGASGPVSASTLKITDWVVSTVNPDLQKPWQHTVASMSKGAYQGQNGGTLGSTALSVNSTIPGAAVPTNTTAALGSGLGGNFQETVTLATPTDGIISSFQNPAGSVTQTPRNLYVTGVSISGAVITVLAATAYTACWQLAFGHTAVSLATVDGVTGTKAPRRIALGVSALASAQAAGTAVAGPSVKFDTPILVQPGEFIQTISKKATAAPASGSILWMIQFDGYFE